MLGERWRGWRLMAAALICGAMATGCDEEPFNVGPDRGLDASIGGDDMSPPPDPEPEPVPDAGRCEPRSVFDPDPDFFAAEIAAPLYTACGLCHYDAAPRPGIPFTLVTNGPGGLTPQQNQLNVDECLSFVDAADPANSQLIIWHPAGHIGYLGDGPLKDDIIEWIEAGTQIIEPEPGACLDEVDMGADGGAPPNNLNPPCEALLSPDGNGGARSMTFRNDFERPDPSDVSHNDILVGSCANNGTCHAIAGEGGDYWLLGEDSECAVEWNYIASQIYIDWLNPLLSPLLTQPRSVLHGGRDVFRGQDDSRHVRLLNWIRAEITRSTRGG